MNHEFLNMIFTVVVLLYIIIISYILVKLIEYERRVEDGIEIPERSSEES